jgi:hypothetical protein
MGKRDLLLDDAVDDVPTIKVNEDFARRFEVRKAAVSAQKAFVAFVKAGFIDPGCSSWRRG